ncbi:MAG: hypothetical protein K9G46_02025 [Flavobacteriales bacterium]|nr:hypothetical protein [Flavobacteriales bacterium]
MRPKPLVDTTIDVLKNLPSDSTIEDIMYELNLTNQVLKGLDDAENGRTITTSELLDRMQKWRKA